MKRGLRLSMVALFRSLIVSNKIRQCILRNVAHNDWGKPLTLVTGYEVNHLLLLFLKKMAAIFHKAQWRVYNVMAADTSIQDCSKTMYILYISTTCPKSTDVLNQQCRTRHRQLKSKTPHSNMCLNTALHGQCMRVPLTVKSLVTQKDPSHSMLWFHV